MDADLQGKIQLTEEQAVEEYDKAERGIRYQLIESKLAEQYDLKIDLDQIKRFCQGHDKNTNVTVWSQLMSMSNELNDIAARILGNQEEVKRISDQLMSKKMTDLFRAEANLKTKKVSYEDFIKQAYKS